MVRGHYLPDTERWSLNWPTEGGTYWFFGNKTKHRRGDPPKLHLVECNVAYGTQLFYHRGELFLKADGGYGLWRRIKHPDPPFDYQIEEAKKGESDVES